MQLEHHLIVERQSPQALEQQPLLLARRDPTDRRTELERRYGGEVDPRAPARLGQPPLAVLLAQHPVRDRKQVDAKARLVPEALAALDARQEGPLDQIGPGLADLV